MSGQSFPPSAFFPGGVKVVDMVTGRVLPEAGSSHSACVSAPVMAGLIVMVCCVGR
jgi:hypothetical protein